MVHPKLQEMIDICDQYDANIFFVTNGVLMRHDKFELMLHKRLYQINFSLHSFFDNFPDKDPTNYLERIFSFTERALEERGDMYLNFRLWNLNDPIGSPNLVDGQTPNAEILARICDRFHYSPPSKLDVRKRKSFNIRERLYLHFDTEFTWPAIDLPALGSDGTCYGLSSHFGVLVDGTVVPCCLDKEAAIPLGNMINKPILEILGSKRSQDIIKGFKQNRLVEDLCKRCQYIERFDKTNAA